MIQKRYEFFGRTGIEWTKWFDYSPNDELLERFQTQEKYQLSCSKLRNEFRIV